MIHHRNLTSFFWELVKPNSKDDNVLSGGVCELGGAGPRRLCDHPSGRSAAALRCCPAGRGVSGEREHAHR